MIVWFFAKDNWDINRKIVTKRINLPYKEFLQKCISELEGMVNNNILNGMGELLTEKQKDWTKAKLKIEVIFFLKMMLSNEK